MGTSRLLTHVIVLVMAMAIASYNSLGKGIPPNLRLGATNADALLVSQGGSVGSVALGRHGIVIKPVSIPAQAPVSHLAIRYTVGNNEDIKAIAAKFNLLPDDVCGSNPGLATNTRLKPGDMLMMPPTRGIVVIAKAGDTAETIARTYQTGLTDILDYNYLRDPSEVREGLQLVLPGGKGVRCYGPAPAQARPGWSSLRLGPPGCPIHGAIVTQPFGPSRLEGWHSGIDLAAPAGTPILAAADGVASIAIGGYGYGNNVAVRVSTDRSDLYGHMSEIDVGPGQAVQAGQMIGRVGSTGFSTGPHLHYEVRIDGTAIDPVPLLRC